MNLSLEGRVALVTGGSRGIGAATVRMFVAAGARVFFNYKDARAEAEAIVAELGDRCATARCDLSGVAAARALVLSAVERFGRLDILAPNHGLLPPNDPPIHQPSASPGGSTRRTKPPSGV